MSNFDLKEVRRVLGQADWEEQQLKIELANRLKMLRKNLGLTQQELADLLDISRAAYAYYETGANSPKLYFLLRLADFYQVSIDYLLGRDPSKYRSEKRMDSD